MVSKLAISASFTAIYLITTEIFPTVMRNFSMGCCGTVGRMGAVVSPYIADLVRSSCVSVALIGKCLYIVSPCVADLVRSSCVSVALIGKYLCIASPCVADW